MRRKIDREALKVARALGVKQVVIVTINDGKVEYGGNFPILIDETSGKRGAIRRLTLMIPTE